MHIYIRTYIYIYIMENSFYSRRVSAPGFLKSLSCNHVCVCVCVCVYVIDGCGPSNKMYCQLMPKKTNYKGSCIICLYSGKRHFSLHSLLKRWSTLILEVGVLYEWQYVYG